MAFPFEEDRERHCLKNLPAIPWVLRPSWASELTGREVVGGRGKSSLSQPLRLLVTALVIGWLRPIKLPIDFSVGLHGPARRGGWGEGGLNAGARLGRVFGSVSGELETCSVSPRFPLKGEIAVIGGLGLLQVQ